MEKNTEKNSSQKEELKVTQSEVNNIYSEDNLITGSNDTDEVKKEFESWFKVKIKGLVNSYKVHEDGSLQIKFREVVKDTIDGYTFDNYVDKSIRIKKPDGTSFVENEVSGIVNKTVEIINITERPQYKKKGDGEYDFSRIESYFYSADNIKVINEKVPNNYQLYKIFELNVMDVVPSVTYNQRKRTKEIEKDKCIIIYETTNDTLTNTHQLIVEGLSIQNGLKLRNKDIVVLDLKIIGKKYYCSKIKLKK